MVDFFTEIKDEVQQEKLFRFIKENSKYIIFGAVSVIVFFAIYTTYQNFKLKKIEETGVKYFHAQELLRMGQKEAAIAAFKDVSQNGSSGYRELASFDLANLFKSSNPEDSIKILTQVSDDWSSDQNFKNLALISIANYQLDKEQIDPETLKNLTKLANTKNNKWNNFAREIIANQLIKDGKALEAKSYLEKILLDASAPKEIKQRAQLLSGSIANE